MIPIIETHCHLDYLKAAPLPEILKESFNSGVEKILTISVQPGNFDDAFNIANENEKVYFTQGIHPHEAKLATEEAYLKIKERANHAKMLAVGEIGLDYHYTRSPKETQIEVFKRQLQLAIELDKPVVIHSRDADEDMIEILSEYAPKMNKKGVIHSFTSGVELAKKALELGFYLGFNGIITFKTAQNVRDIVSITPVNRILLETDAPFLTPVPHRGTENSPKHLPHILDKVCEIKELAKNEVAKAVYQNSLDLFGF